MSYVTLPKTITPHPALDKQRKIIEHNPAIHSDALRVVLVNLMDAPAGYEVKFLRLIAASLRADDRPVHVTFWRPDSIEDTQDVQDHCALYYQKDLDLTALDRVIISGRVPHQDSLEDEPYYPDITRLMEDIKTRKVPTMAFCLAAHIGLFHFHSIPRKRLNAKLFGVFPQDIAAPDAPFVKGLKGRSFDMPVSRFYYSDEGGIVGEANVQVLATSKETGASIVQDGSITYLTGHPEYAANTLKLEYERDQGLDTNALPLHYDVNNPQDSWSADSQIMIRAFLSDAVT